MGNNVSFSTRVRAEYGRGKKEEEGDGEKSEDDAEYQRSDESWTCARASKKASSKRDYIMCC